MKICWLNSEKFSSQIISVFVILFNGEVPMEILLQQSAQTWPSIFKPRVVSDSCLNLFSHPRRGNNIFWFRTRTSWSYRERNRRTTGRDIKVAKIKIQFLRLTSGNVDCEQGSHYEQYSRTFRREEAELRKTICQTEFTDDDY